MANHPVKRAVLLLSSGLDSAANLKLSEPKFRVELALTLDYGQRGAMREADQATKLAGYFGIEHVTFDLRHFNGLIDGKSALLGGQAVPSPDSLDDPAITTKSAAAVWVPNRNGVMLSIAAALAESRGLDAVAVGFNAEEAVTFPDNTPGYMEAMTRSFAYSTANKVEVVSATASLNKKQIVEALVRAEGRRFPFELLWSCYQAGETHCGQCESCQRLERAVRTAMVGDARDQLLATLFHGQERR